MRELKLQLNIYSPRDHLRIQNHLTEMAAKGWMLEQVDRFFWRYRVCEPKKLRFSVLFFQNLDWEEPYRQQCEDAGWQFVSGFAGMQVFCTEDPQLQPLQIDPTPRWKAIHKSVQSRDRYLWLGLIALALTVLASTGITAYSDPIEVLADAPRLMYAVLMIGIVVFVLVDMIHYHSWRGRARRQYNKTGTFPKPKGNLVGICVGLALLTVLFLVTLVLEDAYGRLVALLNIASILIALLAAVGYSLLKKRKSAERKVAPIATISIALVTFLLLGIVQSALLSSWDFSCQPEDMTLTVESLTGQEEEGTCLVEEQYSPFLTDLTGRNIVAYEETETVLWYRLTIAKIPKLVDFTHEHCLPAHLQEKLEPQDPALWQAEQVWLHRGSNGMYTYYVYYADRAATILVSWELTQQQVTTATNALVAVSASNG